MSDFGISPIGDIKAKCEQYWNEPGPLLPEEVHSILGFIHRAAVDVEARLEAMERAAQTLALDLAGQIDTTEKRQSLANRLVKEHLAAQEEE